MRNRISMHLSHHGIIGQRWGVRNGPPYPINPTPGGMSKATGTLFVSGSSKTQDPESTYFRKKLPGYVKSHLDRSMRSGKKIVVGDAPGVDRQVQDYLKSKGYKNVTVYSPGKQTRYSADSTWKVEHVDSDAPEGSKEWLAKKDIAMTNEATEGLAVILNQGSSATRANIDRLLQQNKSVKVYQLSSDGKRFDSLIKDTLQFSTRTVQATDLNLRMQNQIKYKDFSRLKSADEVAKTKSGDCHSQAQYEYRELKNIGLEPRALFLIEYDPKTNAGGSTHSLVFYKDGGKSIWVENAWEDQKGVHIYNSERAMLRDIKKKFVEAGDNSKYSKLAISEYNPEDHQPGESLQEFVEKNLS